MVKEVKKKLPVKILPTTVVGSFPLENNTENMERVFVDEIKLGLDYPSYPQLVDMTDQFLRPLGELFPSHFERRGEKWFLREPFSVPDAPLALEYGEFVLKYLRKNPDASEKIMGTKACLTGPFTLASAIHLDENMASSRNIKPFVFKEPRAIMDPELLETCAGTLAIIANAYSDMGFDIITMDEPALSFLTGRRVILTYTPDYVIEVLNKALRGIKKTSSIHVCGIIPPLLRDVLLKSDVNIVDHEFTDGQNFDVYTRKNLEANKKFLAFGSVESKVLKIRGVEEVDRYVESVSKIEEFIKKGIDLFGAENIIIKPDCGLGGLRGTFDEETAYSIAIKKLDHLVQATNNIREKI